MATKAKKNGSSKAKNGNGQKPKLAAGKRQLEIPAAARKTNPDLDKLIAPYVETLYRRMEFETMEPAMRDAIYAKMEELKVPVYLYRDGEFEYEVKRKLIDPKKKVAVKRREVQAAA